MTIAGELTCFTFQGDGSRKGDAMNTRLVHLGMEYQLAKQQQDNQALAHLGSISTGLMSKPSQIADSLITRMDGWDSVIEYRRFVEIDYSED